MGPVAALALALLALRELWKAHRDSDARTEKRADETDRRLASLVDALTEGFKKAEPK